MTRECNIVIALAWLRETIHIHYVACQSCAKRLEISITNRKKWKKKPFINIFSTWENPNGLSNFLCLLFSIFIMGLQWRGRHSRGRPGGGGGVGGCRHRNQWLHPPSWPRAMTIVIFRFPGCSQGPGREDRGTVKMEKIVRGRGRGKREREAGKRKKRVIDIHSRPNYCLSRCKPMRKIRETLARLWTSGEFVIGWQ